MVRESERWDKGISENENLLKKETKLLPIRKMTEDMPDLNRPGEGGSEKNGVEKMAPEERLSGSADKEESNADKEVMDNRVENSETRSAGNSAGKDTQKKIEENAEKSQKTDKENIQPQIYGQNAANTEHPIESNKNSHAGQEEGEPSIEPNSCEEANKFGTNKNISEKNENKFEKNESISEKTENKSEKNENKSERNKNISEKHLDEEDENTDQKAHKDNAQGTNATFETAFLNDWTIAANRVEHGRKVCERLNEILQERASIEADYAVRMYTLVSKFNTINVEASGVLTAVNALKAETVGRAHQSEELAEAIKKDILIQTLSNTIANHSHVFKQIKKDGMDSWRVLENAREEQRLAAARFSVAATESEHLSLRCQCSDTQNPGYKTDLAIMALRKCEEGRSLKEEYETKTGVLRETSGKVAGKMRVILRSLYDMDSKRILCLKDALRKLMVYDTAYLRNLQYDHCATIQAVEAIDCEQEIQEFIARFVSQDIPTPSLQKPILVKPWTEIKADPSVFKTDGTPVSAARALFQKSYFKVQSATSKPPQQNLLDMPEPPEQAIIEKLQEEFHEKMNFLWLGKMDDFKKLKNYFNDAFQTSLKRYALSQTLSKFRNQKRTQLPSVYALRGLGGLCEIVLNWSDKQRDVWTGRILMILCQQFYAMGDISDDPQSNPWTWDPVPPPPPGEAKNGVNRIENIEGKAEKNEKIDEKSDEKNDEKNEKNDEKTDEKNDSVPEGDCRFSLHRCIYHHPYWNRVSFWEEALILTISEDLQRKILAERWATKLPEEYILLEKNFRRNNPCASNLGGFGFSMVTYGIGVEQVKGLIKKICQQFNLGGEYENTLLESISHFSPVKGGTNVEEEKIPVVDPKQNKKPGSLKSFKRNSSKPEKNNKAIFINRKIKHAVTPKNDQKISHNQQGDSLKNLLNSQKNQPYSSNNNSQKIQLNSEKNQLNSEKNQLNSEKNQFNCEPNYENDSQNQDHNNNPPFERTLLEHFTSEEEEEEAKAAEHAQSENGGENVQIEFDQSSDGGADDQIHHFQDEHSDQNQN